MHFAKIVPSIFYADIKIALKTFIDCLEFTMGHDEPDADKEHPEIRLVTDNIDEVCRMGRSVSGCNRFVRAPFEFFRN